MREPILMRIATTILMIIFANVMLYLAGAFIGGSFNSANWDGFLKAIMVMIALFASATVAYNYSDWFGRTLTEELYADARREVKLLREENNKLKHELEEERKPKAPDLSI